jgi:hypothetical protein
MTKRILLYHAGIGARWASLSIIAITIIAVFRKVTQGKLNNTNPIEIGGLVLWFCLAFALANLVMFLGRNSRDIRPFSRHLTRILSKVFGLVAQIQAIAVLIYLFALPLLFHIWNPGDEVLYLIILFLDLILTWMVDMYADQLWSWSVLKKI